ncbi:MAG: TIGR00282 family metallophosphoesterase [Phycisphaerales bacterium]
MDELRILFIGDVVGTPGREILTRELPGLRERFSPHRVIVNAENARNGSGLSPDIAAKLFALGADALTLGDHAYRDRRVVPLLEDPDTPVLRPANLSANAPGTSLIRIPPSPACPRDLWVFTVLGRVGMNLPADDPFACADRILAGIPEREPIVLVEAHMEATSEKTALGLHLDGRVSAVLGTHTHVPTADARILRQGTGFISDVGMTGPYDSVIGRDASAVLRHMTTGVHVPYEVARGREAVGGCLVAIDPASRRCRRIEPFVTPGFQQRSI